METLIKFDFWLYKLINQELTHPVMDKVMPIITDLHKRHFFWGLVVLTLAVWIYREKKEGLKKIGIMILAAGFSDTLCHRVLKEVFERSRPPDDMARVLTFMPRGYSFPSNHATTVFTLMLLLSFFYPKYKVYFLSFAVLIAYSRVYVGVHHPLDVIAGAITAIVIAFSIRFILQKNTNLLA